MSQAAQPQENPCPQPGEHLNHVVSVCSCCGMQRNELGFWQSAAVLSPSAFVSHTLCLECARALYPEIAEDLFE